MFGRRQLSAPEVMPAILQADHAKTLFANPDVFLQWLVQNTETFRTWHDCILTWLYDYGVTHGNFCGSELHIWHVSVIPRCWHGDDYRGLPAPSGDAEPVELPLWVHQLTRLDRRQLNKMTRDWEWTRSAISVEQAIAVITAAQQ